MSILEVPLYTRIEPLDNVKDTFDRGGGGGGGEPAVLSLVERLSSFRGDYP